MKKLFAIAFLLTILAAFSRVRGQEVQSIYKNGVFWDSAPYDTPTYQKTETYTKYEMKVHDAFPKGDIRRSGHFPPGASRYPGLGHSRSYVHIDTGSYVKTVSRDKRTDGYEQWNPRTAKVEVSTVTTETKYVSEEKRPALNPQPRGYADAPVRTTTWQLGKWFKK